MFNNLNWPKIKEQFEKEMSDKLKDLPGHREVPEKLREFRNIISHELPETAPKSIFRKLIIILLQNKNVDVVKVRKNYLEPQLKKESDILIRNQKEFNQLKWSVSKWVEKNLSEDKLQKLWEEHKTWLPRRYTIYKNPNIPFQNIAADTLARYVLIKSEGITKN